MRMMLLDALETGTLVDDGSMPRNAAEQLNRFAA
jgi:hypothetical protein